MASATSAFNKPSTSVQWMWNSNANPFSKSDPDHWSPYSDVENMIIEEAFVAGESLVEIDDYGIDLKHKVQISNKDFNEQRPIKRMECDEDDKHLRKERYLPNPVAPDRPFGDPYGFISPFIKQVVKDLNLTKERLPSKNEVIVPDIVEKAALGIIEEGKKIRKQREAERIANLLRERKEAGMKKIWERCAYLYSLNSFLHQQLNKTMRSIGSAKHEQDWRSKVGTLGPFCLLLWDNPFNSKMVKPGTILYRGAQLSEDLITSFKNDCSKDLRPWHSFQAFTSCSRNRGVAEMYGNVMFIMETRIAFTADIQAFSNFEHEEEELLFPGVSFTINRVDDKGENKNKPLIYIILQQRRNKCTNPAPAPTRASHPDVPDINNCHFAPIVFNRLPDRRPDPDQTFANTNDIKQSIHDFIARCAYDIFHDVAVEQGVGIDDIRGLADNIILDRRANAYFGDADPVRFGGAAAVDVNRDDVYFDRTGCDSDWD